MGQLEKYVRDHRRSRTREYVLTTRLIHDVSVAAADRGYDLQVYIPTVDMDGFDVIFDDRDLLVPIQLKSVVAGGRASGWSIHRSLIRPRIEDADLFGFEPSPTGTGRAGGVILTTVAAEGGELAVTYSFTDVYVLSLYWQGYVPLPKPQASRLDRLRNDLEQDPSGKVKVPRSAFVKAHSPAHLLALCGLHSGINSSWRSLLRSLLEYDNEGRRGDIPRAVLLNELRADLARIT